MLIRYLNFIHLISLAAFASVISINSVCADEASKESKPSFIHLDRLSFYVIPADDTSENLDKLLEISRDRAQQLSVWKKSTQLSNIHFSIMKLESNKDFVNLKSKGIQADLFSLPDENLEVLATLVSLKKSTVDLSRTIARTNAQNWMIGSLGLIPVSAIPAYQVYEEGSKYLAAFFLFIPVPLIAHSVKLKLEAEPDSWLSKKVFRTESKTIEALNTVLSSKRNNQSMITLLVSSDENKIRWLESTLIQDPQMVKISN